MIGRWGMSDEMGLLFASDTAENPFLGREMAGPRDRSEATAAWLDDAVRHLLAERMEAAVNLLTEHRDTLDRLAVGLLEHETLDREQVAAVIRGDDLPPVPPASPAPTVDRPSASSLPGIVPA
jgi:cell division protease FtsH